VKEAPVLIIPTTNTTKTNYPTENLSVASENMFLQATSLGLGSVWKAIKTDKFDGEEKIKDILGLPRQYKVINIIPIGQAKEECKPCTDEDFSLEKVHQEKW